jgi:putative oxidoreductase
MSDKKAAPRSPVDAAALALRLTVGPMLFAHGYNKVFGGGGLKGTTGWFESLGLRPAWLHARMAAGTEMGAGTLLTLGAASPLPAAATIGLMVTATRTDHKGKGFFVFKGGWEYTGVVAAVAAAMATLGPGRISIDGIRGRSRSGILWGAFATALGVVSSLALLKATYKPDQPSDAGDA